MDQENKREIVSFIEAIEMNPLENPLAPLPETSGIRASNSSEKNLEDFFQTLEKSSPRTMKDERIGTNLPGFPYKNHIYNIPKNMPNDHTYIVTEGQECQVREMIKETQCMIINLTEIVVLGFTRILDIHIKPLEQQIAKLENQVETIRLSL